MRKRSKNLAPLHLPPAQLQPPSTTNFAAYTIDRLPSPMLDRSPNTPLMMDDLSDLEKLSVVGHGNGGTVYKVRSRLTASLFALKVLRFDANLVDSWQQVAREADIIMRANSPYVVRGHGVIRGAKDCVCLLMEYMAGGSLRDLLRSRRTLPEELIAAVAKRVLEGLRYLHAMGVVHRDIKPGNLLIGERGEVKIADFGSSRLAAEAPVAGDESCEGTWAYMSPERFDSEGFGGGGGGFAEDVWALGVVALECYVGRFPLVEAGERPDWATLMCSVCLDQPQEVLKSASPELGSFVRRCLEKDWRKRGTVEEMLGHPFVSDFNCCSTAGLIN